jgi:hypothetical protein
VNSETAELYFLSLKSVSRLLLYEVLIQLNTEIIDEGKLPKPKVD